jgi:hypothetical protein
MIFTRSREVAKKDDHEKFFLKRAPIDFHENKNKPCFSASRLRAFA